MIDLTTPPVPELSSDWITARREHLVAEIAAPHRPQPSRRLALSGIGAVGALGAVTAALVLSLAGAGAPSAFAGWSADPTTPTSGQVQAAESHCLKSNPQLASATPTLVDTRGPYTVLVYGASGPGGAGCVMTPSAQGLHQNPDFPLGDLTNATAVAPDAIVPLTGVLAFAGPYAPTATEQLTVQLILSVGRVGTDVTGVTLMLADGTRVEATVTNGWYAAWWPGNPSAQTAAEITTTSGTTTQSLGTGASGVSGATGTTPSN